MQVASIYPQLTEDEIKAGLLIAQTSSKHRHALILHKPGDEFNRAVNFILRDSYMQPHMHPGSEKIEDIYLIAGTMSVFFFDENGRIEQSYLLHDESLKKVTVPAFTWHTYTVLSEFAVTYETMMGVYDVKTWKKFAMWAPPELTSESYTYHHKLCLAHLKVIAANNL